MELPNWADNIDRLIGIGGIAFGITSFFISILYARHLYRKSQRDKLLYVDKTEPMLIGGVLKALGTPMVVMYADRPVETVHRSYVLLWNRGHRPFEPSDFVDPILATCGPSGEFLGVGVHEVDLATNVSISHSADQQTATISVQLLRPGEGAILFFDSDSPAARPNLKIELKDPNAIYQPNPLFTAAKGILVVLILGAIGISIIALPERLLTQEQYLSIWGLIIPLGMLFIYIPVPAWCPHRDCQAPIFYYGVHFPGT